MREIPVGRLTDTVAALCEEINYRLSDDMVGAVCAAAEKETEPLGKEILAMLKSNLEAAKTDRVPICQDTGMAVVFLQVGQEVHFTGGPLNEAINEGVRRGYRDGYLRKSVVAHPLDRVNTGDNTPAVIHTEIVPGDTVTVTLTAKGFGSENTGRIWMLKPADGREGVKEAVLQTVAQSGKNACPPLVIGVGIGGTFEKCALMAKHALTRPVGQPSADPLAAQLERELLNEINATGIGPAGLGGSVTALAVAVECYPPHIAGLPVAVNIGCHVNRHKTVVI